MPLRDRSSRRRGGLQRFNAPATSDINAEQEYRVALRENPQNEKSILRLSITGNAFICCVTTMP